MRIKGVLEVTPYVLTCFYYEIAILSSIMEKLGPKRLQKFVSQDVSEVSGVCRYEYTPPAH